jgi:hypothetical protein
MVSTRLRSQLLRTVERFNAGALDIGGFWEEVEVLNREGLHRELAGGEEARAVAQLTWALDMHDPQSPPRPGLAGRLRDKFDEVFRAEYRVSAEAVEAKALAVERIMKQA